MKMSSKGRYAVTAMMVLAIRNQTGPVTLREIAKEQGISLSYLEQLFSALRDNDLVSGVRGPGGGYRLSRSPSSISIAEIIESVEFPDEGEEVSERPKGNPLFDRANQMWDDFSGTLRGYLGGVTLANYLEDGELKRAPIRQSAEAKLMNFVLPRPQMSF